MSESKESIDTGVLTESSNVFAWVWVVHGSRGKESRSKITELA